jgi:spore coat polysaccharide biosynthesis predicted glycosyltransferase SpsG
MKITIITEGFKGVGFGHLSRCLSLYQAFDEKGITPNYIANLDDSGKKFINDVNLTIIDWLKEKEELLRVSRQSDVIIIDSYLADYNLYERLRKSTKKIVYIDDYMRLDYPLGIIVNCTIGAENFPYRRVDGHEYLLGVNYIPLRKEFWDITPRFSRQTVKDVLVIFGAQDIQGMTDRTLHHLLMAFPEYAYHAVLGLNPDIVENGFDRSKIQFYRNLSASKILQLMWKCDLAISAGGQTTYELARVGVPTIAIGLAENQRNNIRGWIEKGFLKKELWYDDDNLFEELIGEIITKADGVNNNRNFCDGQGARRITEFLLK